MIMEQNERFDRFYSETRDDLLRYLMLRTNAAPEAEDLFQEVYRRFYMRMTHSVIPILDPRRYLFSIAKKVLAGYYRSASIRRETEQPIEEEFDLPSDDDPIEAHLMREERMDEIWKLLQQEPELNRRIFLLYYGYDRPQQKIASSLGITEKAVRQRLYRTRSKIRSMLEHDERSSLS